MNNIESKHGTALPLPPVLVFGPLARNLEELRDEFQSCLLEVLGGSPVMSSSTGKGHYLIEVPEIASEPENLDIYAGGRVRQQFLTVLAHYADHAIQDSALDFDRSLDLRELLRETFRTKTSASAILDKYTKEHRQCTLFLARFVEAPPGDTWLLLGLSSPDNACDDTESIEIFSMLLKVLNERLRPDTRIAPKEALDELIPPHTFVHSLVLVPLERYSDPQRPRWAEYGPILSADYMLSAIMLDERQAKSTSRLVATALMAVTRASLNERLGNGGLPWIWTNRRGLSYALQDVSGDDLMIIRATSIAEQGTLRFCKAKRAETLVTIKYQRVGRMDWRIGFEYEDNPVAKEFCVWLVGHLLSLFTNEISPAGRFELKNTSLDVVLDQMEAGIGGQPSRAEVDAGDENQPTQHVVTDQVRARYCLFRKIADELYEASKSTKKGATVRPLTKEAVARAAGKILADLSDEELLKALQEYGRVDFTRDDVRNAFVAMDKAYPGKNLGWDRYTQGPMTRRIRR